MNQDTAVSGWQHLYLHLYASAVSLQCRKRHLPDTRRSSWVRRLWPAEAMRSAAKKAGLVPVVEEAACNVDAGAVLTRSGGSHRITDSQTPRDALPSAFQVFRKDIGAVATARPWYTCFTNGVYQILARRPR